METPKKTLPHAVTKQQLVDLFINQMPEAKILKAANLIIYDSRKNKPLYQADTQQKIIATRYVTHPEFMEFIETYGMPKGY